MLKVGTTVNKSPKLILDQKVQTLHPIPRIQVHWLAVEQQHVLRMGSKMKNQGPPKRDHVDPHQLHGVERHVLGKKMRVVPTHRRELYDEERRVPRESTRPLKARQALVGHLLLAVYVVERLALGRKAANPGLCVAALPVH
jgi:hypothetical protein